MLKAQRGEITEHFIYNKLAGTSKNPHNAGILRRISEDELRHYNLWKNYSGQDIQPLRLKTWLYYLLARVFGLTFSLKLMERGEEKAQSNYMDIAQSFAVAQTVAAEEDVHEDQLLRMIDEEHLRYMGAIVRGLNEGLVELAGALAGFTLVLHDTGLVAAAGLIISLAMSLSLAGTEFLATKSEEPHQHPLKAAL